MGDRRIDFVYSPVAPENFAREHWKEFDRSAITVVSNVHSESSVPCELAMTTCLAKLPGSPCIGQHFSVIVSYVLNMWTRNDAFKVNAANEITLGGRTVARVSTVPTQSCSYQMVDLRIRLEPKKYFHAGGSPASNIRFYPYLSAFGRSESSISLFQLTGRSVNPFNLQLAIIKAFHVWLTLEHRRRDDSVNGLNDSDVIQGRAIKCSTADDLRGGRRLPDYPIQFVHLPSTDSTQIYCEKHLNDFNLDVLPVVSADFQTAGKGTSSRRWEADAGRNVLMSFIVRFPLHCNDPFLVENIPCTTKILSLAILDALDVVLASIETTSEKAVCKTSMKWPNDILLNEKKIGGILAQCVPTRRGTAYRLDTVIIGVGLNVNTRDDTLDGIHRPVWPASSIGRETGRDLDVAQLRILIAESFYRLLQIFYHTGFTAFKDRCTAREIYVGREIKFKTGEAVITGIFRGIGERGEILLETSGEIMRLLAGEIVP